MKVLVVGAHGKIGSRVVNLLEQSGQHSVRAFVRKEEHAEELKEKGIEAHLGDLEAPVADLEEAVKGTDAVVFSAGSGGDTGADKTLLIDLDGAVKVMEAAKNLGVDRFILVSAFGADDRSRWGNKIRPFYVAKHYADKELERSGLNYTIVRPGVLLDEEGKGKVKAAVQLKLSSLDDRGVSREDVARAIVASLDNENTYRKGFDLVSGDKEISEALNQL